MLALPATYLEVRVQFMLRKRLLSEVAQDVGATIQHVHTILRTYWGRSDVEPRGELAKAILARVAEILQEPWPPQVTAGNEPVSSDIDNICHVS